MSVIKVNNITNRDGTSGPVIAGIATVSSTSHLVVPTGNTGQKVALAPDPFINNLVLALPFNSESVFDDVSPKSKATPSISGISTTASLPFGVSGVTTTSSGIVTFSKYYGNSLYLDGSNDYLAFVNDSSLNFGGESYTIEFWMNPNPISNGMIVSLYNESSNRGSWFIRTDSTGYVRWGENSNGAGGGLITLDTAAGVVATGQWYHCAFVKNAPQQTRTIFINGNSTVSTGSTLTVSNLYTNTQDPVMIGSFNLLSSPSTFFSGYLQDLRIYKGVAKYTSNFTPPTQIAL
jgi:hypothetical protein